MYNTNGILENLKELLSQEKELQKLKEKIEEQKEEILSRAKQHNNANAEASIKYIKELNSNLEEYLKHKDNER
jgi:recombinational DNA repair protein RecR